MVLIAPIRHSSKVSPITIISSIYIATITPSILKHAMGGLVSFVNFHGPEDNPFGSTTNFKRFLPT